MSLRSLPPAGGTRQARQCHLLPVCVSPAKPSRALPRPCAVLAKYVGYGRMLCRKPWEVPPTSLSEERARQCLQAKLRPLPGSSPCSITFVLHCSPILSIPPTESVVVVKDRKGSAGPVFSALHQHPVTNHALMPTLGWLAAKQLVVYANSKQRATLDASFFKRQGVIVEHQDGGAELGSH